MDDFKLDIIYINKKTKQYTHYAPSKTFQKVFYSLFRNCIKTTYKSMPLVDMSYIYTEQPIIQKKK